MVEPNLHDLMASTEEKLEQRDHRGWTEETTHVTLTKETGNRHSRLKKNASGTTNIVLRMIRKLLT